MSDTFYLWLSRVLLRWVQHWLPRQIVRMLRRSYVIRWADDDPIFQTLRRLYDSIYLCMKIALTCPTLQPSQRAVMEALERKADVAGMDERLRLVQQELVTLNSRVGKKAEVALFDEVRWKGARKGFHPASDFTTKRYSPLCEIGTYPESGSAEHPKVEGAC